LGKTNRAWHERHRMPKNPTAAQRIAWHVAHAENCTCRPIPPGVLALMRAETARGVDAKKAAPARPAKD
jgi:hypothetical protein